MKISVILPCYNEEKCIEKNIKIIYDYMNKNFKDWELLVINDGSKDNTYYLALKYINQKKDDKIKIYTNIKNKGKGFSVVRGLYESEGDYFLILDCDLSTDISELSKIIRYKDRYDMIISSRYMRKSIIKKRQSLLRILYSRCFNLLVKMLFRLKFHDTQNGFKLMNRIVRNLIMNYSHIKRYSFDVEHLLICKNFGLKIKEVPIIWEDKKPKKVKLKQIGNMYLDLITIKKFERLGLY